MRSVEEEDFLESSHPVLFCLINRLPVEPFVCFWRDNVKKWASLSMSELLTKASCRKREEISAELSLVFPRRSSRSVG